MINTTKVTFLGSPVGSNLRCNSHFYKMFSDWCKFSFYFILSFYLYFFTNKQLIFCLYSILIAHTKHLCRSLVLLRSGLGVITIQSCYYELCLSFGFRVWVKSSIIGLYLL